MRWPKLPELLLLCVLCLPAPRAFAFRVPTEKLINDPATSFRTFWNCAEGYMETVQPNPSVSPGGTVRFTGAEQRPRSARVSSSWGAARMRAIVISDYRCAPLQPPVPGVDQYSFAWREGALESDLLTSQISQHALYKGILDTCRLASIISEQNTPIDTPIGIVGEGYAASIAIAVASLLPETIDVVIAHQPMSLSVPLMSALAGRELDEIETTCIERLACKLNPDLFAPGVECPCLISYGTRDVYATPVSVIGIYRSLGGPKTLWRLPDYPHCPTWRIPGWTWAWARWARAAVR